MPRTLEAGTLGKDFLGQPRATGGCGEDLRTWSDPIPVAVHSFLKSWLAQGNVHVHR